MGHDTAKSEPWPTNPGPNSLRREVTSPLLMFQPKQEEGISRGIPFLDLDFFYSPQGGMPEVPVRERVWLSARQVPTQAKRVE